MTCCVSDTFCDTSKGCHMNCKTTSVEGKHVTGFKVPWRQGVADEPTEFNDAHLTSDTYLSRTIYIITTT